MTMDHLTERVLHLTLEIICLLTGQMYPSVQSDHVTIRVSPLPSMIIKRTNKQKILDFTHMIIELLSGEIGNGPGEVKEEDAGMMEDKKGLPTSLDGPSEGIPPEGSPLHSSHPTQEDHMIPAHDQEEDVIAIKVEVLDEEPRYGCTEDQGAVQGKEVLIPTNERIPAAAMTADGSYITRGSCGGNAISRNLYPGLHSADGSLNPGNPEESSENGETETNRSECMKHEGDQPLEDEKPHVCSHCGRRFNKKANLIRHCLLHTGEKPLTCPDCGKSFARKSNLIDHQRTHTGEKPFPCTECHKSFTQKSNLIRHQRTHRDERIIICSECGKYFTHEAFVVHQSIHRGEEPFHCYECGQCFTQKSDLLAHQRYHAGDHTGLS